MYNIKSNDVKIRRHSIKKGGIPRRKKPVCYHEEDEDHNQVNYDQGFDFLTLCDDGSGVEARYTSTNYYWEVPCIHCLQTLRSYVVTTDDTYGRTIHDFLNERGLNNIIDWDEDWEGVDPSACY